VTIYSVTNSIQRSDPSVENPSSRVLLIVRLWHFLHHPLLLIAVATLILLLILAALGLPQLPGQHMDDSLERSRWLASVQEEYGLFGSLLAGLGLFNLAQSLVLRLLLALLTLLVLMQLGDLFIMWQQRRHLHELIRQPVMENGAPLPVPGLRPLYRRRLTLLESPSVATPQVRQAMISVTPSRPNQLIEARQSSPTAENAEEETDGRWLLLSSSWALRLRLAALLGISMALAVSWFALTWGWEVRPPTLTPGEGYRLPSRNLSLLYQVMPEANAEDVTAEDVTAEEITASAQQPTLVIRMNQERVALPVTGPNRRRLDNVSIWVQPAGPALLVESWQDDKPVMALTLPGQDALVARLGFTFSAVGSEESIVIPEARVGLRIVQLSNGAQFLVEIERADTQEVERIEIQSDDAVLIPLSPNQLDEPLVLRFRFLPSLDVRLRYVPGEWLFWPALLLAAIGAVGFWRRPYFLLCQLGHWPTDRSVLVVQSDAPHVANALVAEVTGESAGAGADKVQG
jgi:hypothetical protein